MTKHDSDKTEGIPKITDEMIEAGKRVLDQSRLCERPSDMNYPLAEEIIRAALISENKEIK